MLRLALVLSSAAVAGLAPQALVAKLLKTPIRDSELPHGFTHAQVEKQAVSVNGRKYHAVGLVDAALKGPDVEDAIAWVVFPNRADAVGDLDNPAVGNGVRVIDVVPGIKQSLVLTSTLNGTTITDAAAVVGNVLVQGVVGSKAVRTPTAIILLKAAMAHVRRIR
jgi:hypothetical protein